ncbi:MAG: glycosyltransferase family 2 protein [Dehalococcoidia bacterium]
MMLVKDEADVVGEVLRANAEWCDRIYVIDNGSSDGSWEIVQDLASSIPAVVPFARDLRPFSDGLRGTAFEAHRREASPGDWWCKMDADEIYIDDPRTFLEAVPWRYRRVWNSSYQYFFTDRDLERYEADPVGFLATPVEQRIRYYLNSWSEPRFFRHTRGIVWPRTRDGRFIGGSAVGVFGNYPRRIRLKHYQFRSPEQIQHRLEARLQAPDGEFVHEKLQSWRSDSFSAEVDRRLSEQGSPAAARCRGKTAWSPPNCFSSTLETAATSRARRICPRFPRTRTTSASSSLVAVPGAGRRCVPCARSACRRSSPGV